MPTTNPIRLVHAAIWTMLRANQTLCGASGLVTLSNQVAYIGTDRIPPRDTLREGSTPEMEVVTTGLRPHLQQTSSGSSLVLRWEIRCTTGSVLFATLMDIQWEIFRALEGWETYMSGLQWDGESVVKISRPLAVRDRMDDHRRNRSIHGWTTVWSCETVLDFTTTDLALGT